MSLLLAEIVWTTDKIAMVGTFGLALALPAVFLWFRLHKARSDNELKRSMVERGMPVDEIERVIAAGEEQGHGWGCAGRKAHGRSAGSDVGVQNAAGSSR